MTADFGGDTALPPTVKPRRLCHPALCVAVLTLTGCGVAAYEKQMQEAETRIQRFDEENRLLGAPLVVPSRPKAPSVSLFVRPPLGVAPASKPEEYPFHYPATSGVCLDMYVARGDDAKKVEKEIEEHFDASALPWQAVTINPPNRQSILFESVEFNDARASANAPAVYQVYVHQSVGVVYHFLKAKREAALPSIQMSMEAYAEAGDAYKAITEYNKRSGH
jgi:hypothetical protein